MASQPGGEVNQQLWDEAITRLLNLSASTVKRNLELEGRVAELEVELSVWKQAHSSTLEAAEREANAHNVQVASLKRQISALESIRCQNPLILCVVDGDGNIFTKSLLAQGRLGGRQAAQQLTQGIAEYLANEDIHIFGRLSFWVSIYFNKAGLIDTLTGHNICSPEQFEAFLVGFSQASPRFLTIDVGFGKEAADAKIREYLQTFTRLPQTLRVFFGGGHDNGYTSTLTALENEQLLGKLVLLQGYSDIANELQKLYLPSLRVEGLFMTQKLSYIAKRPAPLNASASCDDANVNGISPCISNGNGCGRLIDQSLPLHKQSPPPCNEHYLMTCSKNGACKYSHDYLLTPEQLALLASNAKKAPCNWLKNGLQCPHGDKCCWGHTCPGGPKCFHLSKGKCWFKGETMHTPQQEGHSPSVCEHASTGS